MVIYSRTTYSKENVIFAIIIRNVKGAVKNLDFLQLNMKLNRKTNSADEYISEDLVITAGYSFDLTQVLHDF